MRKQISVLLIFVLAAVACGNDDSDSQLPTTTTAVTSTVATTNNTTTVATTAAPTTVAVDTTAAVTTTLPPDFPAQVEGEGFSAYISERPEAIISLSPTATEILFAIGAGPQVIAVGDQSNYPSEAPMTDLSGFQPNVEAIAAYEPDLVVISYDPGGIVEFKEDSEGRMVSVLAGLDIPVIVQGAALSIEGAYEQWLQLGIASGNEDGALSLADQMRAEIDDLQASHQVPSNALSFYVELDPSFYSTTSDSVQGQVFSLFGLLNIADEPGEEAGPYPQLSAEYILSSNPDLIFLPCAQPCPELVDAVAERAGWDVISAVQNQKIITLDRDTFSRWGPRIVDFVEQVGSSIPENS